uniref:Beta-adaptin appendage C-terminal subdomain domain-containing protein n=1 Tax=Globisporangium ultimum (strain ATCC 200006 / CBS 805.95 / DAOM BR144) TaxID=431595 RepID=K3WKF5_GLOUD
MGALMRPNNFRHDMRGSRVVEIRMEEYERSKRSILKTIRFRLVALGVIIGILALVSIVLGIVVRSYHMKIVKFSHRCISVRLRDLYFVYSVFSILFILHGFYMNDNWDRLQFDGNRLVMHVRLYSFLGFGAWLVALWLGAATLSAFGLVETQFIADSSPNLIYLTTLILCCLHLVTSPWLLNTVHKKGSQADEYYGAEFMANLKQQRRSARPRYEVDGGDDDDSDHDAESRSRVTLAQDEEHEEDGVPRRNSRSRSKKRGQKNHKVFYNADGTVSVVTGPEAVVARSSLQGDCYGGPVSPSASLELNLQGGVVQEGLLTSSRASNPDQIPFASPVFLLDREPRLQPNDFCRLWKHVETTGSFSCLFTNEPSKRDVDAHLRKFDFHVISSDAKDNVLQTHFYAYQCGTDLAFLCEFVLVFSRRFFQATFKCKESGAAADFVTRFNLQELLAVESGHD